MSDIGSTSAFVAVLLLAALSQTPTPQPRKSTITTIDPYPGSIKHCTATAANEDGTGECTNRTLRGAYGILVSGIRGVGPTATESFVGTALRTYDGDGQFTKIDNGHGEITGFRQDVPAHGTYEVHANCSGTSLIYFPGAPAPVETAFVIVAHGDEVKDAGMAPARNIVTASLWRVGR